LVRFDLLKAILDADEKLAVAGSARLIIMNDNKARLTASENFAAGADHFGSMCF
jgi:hypothetical protein